MGRTRRVLVAVTSLLTVLSPATAGSVLARAGDVRSAEADLAVVERMLAAPLDQFVRLAASGDPWFDWSTDFCSAPLVGSMRQRPSAAPIIVPSPAKASPAKVPPGRLATAVRAAVCASTR